MGKRHARRRARAGPIWPLSVTNYLDLYSELSPRCQKYLRLPHVPGAKLLTELEIHVSKHHLSSIISTEFSHHLNP